VGRSTVVIELANNPPFARDLAAGGVFVPECALRLTEECDLVVCGVTHQMVIPARVVYVDPRGAGLELLGFTPEMKAQIAELATPIQAEPTPGSALATAQPSGVAIEDEDLHSGFTEPVPLTEADALDDDLEIPSLFGRAPTGAPAPAPPEAPADEELAIPVAAEADYVVTEATVEAPTGDAVFSYGRRGLRVRGGVAQRATDDEAAGDDAAHLGAARGPDDEARAPAVHLGAARGPDGEARAPAVHLGAARGPDDEGREDAVQLGGGRGAEDAELDADGSRMLGAELEAELGLDDLIEPEREANGDASLELDLIDPMMGLDEVPPELRRDRTWAGDAEDAGDGDELLDGEAGEAGQDGEAGEAGEAGQDGDDAGDGARRGKRARFALNVHERLRGLTLAQQIKLAAQGELHERIVLERLYGKNVWETLLRNPRLTAPEVARIARMGSLPRVLLEILVANNAWLQIPEVRRALLSNPRLATDQIVKVLRLTPKHELKLASIQTAYPYAVRTAAKMLLRGD
jgi:hypothetical protein